MPYLKFFIIFIILFSSSCTSNIQKNGLSITKINQIKIKIGETTKDDLNNNIDYQFLKAYSIITLSIMHLIHLVI